MPTLTRDAILAAPAVKIEPIDIPEWGGSCYLRQLTLEQQQQEVEAAGQGSRLEVFCRIVAACLCDEQGNRLLSPEDAKALASKPACVIMRVGTAALALNKLNDADVEQLQKNFESGPSGGSSSSSPGI